MNPTEAPGDLSARPPIVPLAGRCLLQFAIGMLVIALLVLLPAGSLHWPAGWLLLITFTACFAFNMAVLLVCNPEVVAARMNRRRNACPWDRRVTSLTALATLGLFLAAGQDFCWGWTGAWPVWLKWLGVSLLVLGDLLFLWATAINRFFTKEVAIQTERGHHVVRGGPYRFVRHPGYVGFSLMLLGMPLILGSAWAIIPGMLAMFGIIARTHLEDDFLHKGLPGYREYAASVRFRLIPGLW